MADKASRRGAANLGMPLMFLAFIAIGGFLYWLHIQAGVQKQKEEVQMQEAAAERAATYPDAREIKGTDLQQDPGQFAGMLIKTDTLAVASRLGTQGFWLELPNKNPFLVSLDDSLKADSISVTSGQRVLVVGKIYTMTDSTAEAWVASGAISQGDKLAAQFATHYLQARHVGVAKRGAAPGQGNSGGGGS